MIQKRSNVFGRSVRIFYWSQEGLNLFHGANLTLSPDVDQDTDAYQTMSIYKLNCTFVVCILATRPIGSTTLLDFRPPVTENYFSYFSTKTYVVGTQKNRLNDTVVLSAQNRCLN